MFGILFQSTNLINFSTKATTTVWLLESQPLQTNSTGRPGQYLDPQAALNDVQLNFVPENRISYDRIKEATDVRLQSVASR